MNYINFRDLCDDNRVADEILYLNVQFRLLEYYL